MKNIMAQDKTPDNNEGATPASPISRDIGSGRKSGMIGPSITIHGDVTGEESSWLSLVRKEFGQSEDNSEFDPAVLKAAVEDDDDAEELISLLLMVSLADGQTTPGEYELITRVGGLVGVSAERVEELRSETVLAVDPD